MKQATDFLRLCQASRLKPSVNGNPRWKFSARTADGSLWEFRTASDVMCAFDCDLMRPKAGTVLLVEHHKTRVGNLIADHWHECGAVGIGSMVQAEAHAEAAELARATPAAGALDRARRL